MGCLYFKASVVCRAHNVNRDLQEQSDRQNYITKIPMTKLKDTNKRFSGQRGLEHRGGGTEKTENEREIAISTHPLRVSVRHQPALFQKGL